MAADWSPRLRRPEYTGENRCWPCTALNVALVVVASAGVGVVAPALGAVAFGVGLALVALRGYVVPYTPRFAPRVVAALPWSVDVGHPHRADGGRQSGSLAGDAVDGEALLGRLVDAGVVTADESGDLFLADGVRRTWEAGMARLRDVSDGELAAATASAAPFPAEGRTEDEWVVVTRTADDRAAPGAADGEAGDEVWISRPHAVSDTPAVAALGDRVDAETAARAATPLRLFLETCPACGGGVEETVVRDCCGGTAGVYDDPETPVLACTDCEAVLFEF
jgi:hypothetical protein